MSCRYHLFLDVRKDGSVAYPRGDKVGALERMPHSCVLDVADRGGASQKEVGEAINASMQMTSLIELSALARLTMNSTLKEVDG